MKAAGIIMECNPFHEGHAYLLREARSRTDADYIVVAMSGDFVQRGEPAIYDKYIRAGEILRAGADLVLELPLYAACGSAEYFARGGVSLLRHLGVITDLCFGSESGQIESILHCARLLEETSSPAGSSSSCDEHLSDSRTAPWPPQTENAGSGSGFTQTEDAGSGCCFREKLQAGLKSGLSYPAARAAALPGLPDTPNDLLAVEYCRALLWSGEQNTSPITPHAIPRIRVPSATQRRAALLRERADLTALPPSDPAASQVPVFPLGPDDFSDSLLYALRMNEKKLAQYADVSSDIADRIRRLLPQYNGYTDFCSILKSRNLTRTRVSRCLLHILLQIEQSRLTRLQSAGMALYARPLAMKRAAAPLLAAIRQNTSIPFLPKLSTASSLLSPEAYSFLEEEIRAEELYSLTLRAVASRQFAAEAETVPDAPPKNTFAISAEKSLDASPENTFAISAEKIPDAGTETAHATTSGIFAERVPRAAQRRLIIL